MVITRMEYTIGTRSIYANSMGDIWDILISSDGRLLLYGTLIPLEGLKEWNIV